jgi:hypothetical protein
VRGGVGRANVACGSLLFLIRFSFLKENLILFSPPRGKRDAERGRGLRRTNVNRTPPLDN